MSNVQVVTEMIAYKKGGKTGKWNWIVMVELARAAIKGVLLMKSQGMLFNGGQAKVPVPPPHMLGDSAAGREEDALLSLFSDDGVEDLPVSRWWKGARSGAQLPLPREFPKELHSHSNDRAEKQLLAIGEWLHIARPVVYVALR